MEYKLKDGGVIHASNSKEFVTRLRESSKFDNECSDEEYMHNFAARFKVQTGVELDISSPDIFVKSLIKADYISGLD